MAISNYSTLQTEIAGWLNRDDLTSVIPTFISLAEAEMNRDIRHWKMEKRATAVQSGGNEWMKIPSDWLETIRLTIPANGSSRLSQASVATIADIRAENENSSTATPYLYSWADGQFELYPTPTETTTFELLYFGSIPSLDATTTTNWLLTESPDVYLYGALMHSAPYLAEDARAATWGGLYKEAVLKINAASERARHSGTGMTLKIRGLG